MFGEPVFQWVAALFVGSMVLLATRRLPPGAPGSAGVQGWRVARAAARTSAVTFFDKRVRGDDFVEGVRNLSFKTHAVARKPDGEIAVPDGQQSLDQFGSWDEPPPVGNAAATSVADALCAHLGAPILNKVVCVLRAR